MFIFCTSFGLFLSGFLFGYFCRLVNESERAQKEKKNYQEIIKKLA